MFTEILRTATMGYVICHRLDPAQTGTLKATGRPLATPEIDALRPYINKDTVFVDIGANIGSFTLTFAPIAKKVIAFEAQRVICYMLAGSVALNGHQNVWVHNIAISDGGDNICIPQFDYNKQLAFGSVEFGPMQMESIGQNRLPDTNDKVLAGTLSYFVRGDDPYIWGGLPEFHSEKIGVIKIDVEGMELKVLEGASDIIEEDRPVMLVEYLKCGKEPLAEWMISHDYGVDDLGMDFLCIPNGTSHRRVK